MKELLEWLNSLENCIAKDLWGKEIPLINLNNLKNIKHLDISSNWDNDLHKNLFQLDLLSLDCSYCAINENIIFDKYCETYEILKTHDKKPIIKQNSKVSDKIF